MDLHETTDPGYHGSLYYRNFSQDYAWHVMPQIFDITNPWTGELTPKIASTTNFVTLKRQMLRITFSLSSIFSDSLYVRRRCYRSLLVL